MCILLHHTQLWCVLDDRARWNTSLHWAWWRSGSLRRSCFQTRSHAPSTMNSSSSSSSSSKCKMRMTLFDCVILSLQIDQPEIDRKNVQALLEKFYKLPWYVCISSTESQSLGFAEGKFLYLRNIIGYFEVICAPKALQAGRSYCLFCNSRVPSLLTRASCKWKMIEKDYHGM